MPVVAVTSTYTKAALEATKNTWWPILLAYAGGSALAGMFYPKPESYKLSLTPALPLSTAVAGLAVFYAADTKIWPWAALAAGIQNSLTSVLSGNLLRSAHMSGLTSDLGTFIGQWIAGNESNAWKVPVVATLLASFFAGGLLSVVASRQWGANDCLMISVAFYALVSLGLIVLRF